MTRYILRRLLQAIPTLIGVSIISFALAYAAPGDPVTMYNFDPNVNQEALDTLRRQLGLDQPVPVQSPWIDRYALNFRESFFKVLDRHPAIRAVVWGHIHQDFRLERNGALLLGAPSTVANSLPNHEKFTPDLAGPACRWLELYSDGKLETGLIFGR